MPVHGRASSRVKTRSACSGRQVPQKAAQHDGRQHLRALASSAVLTAQLPQFVASQCVLSNGGCIAALFVRWKEHRTCKVSAAGSPLSGELSSS